MPSLRLSIWLIFLFWVDIMMIGTSEVVWMWWYMLSLLMLGRLRLSRIILVFVVVRALRLVVIWCIV